MSRANFASEVLGAYETANAATQLEEAQQLAQRALIQSGYHPTHLAFGADGEESEKHLPANFQRTRYAGRTVMSKREGADDDVAGRNGYQGTAGQGASLVPSDVYDDAVYRQAPFPGSTLAPPGREGAQQISVLQYKLQERLGPEYISSRSGPSGGPKLHYIEGWKAIDLANEAFGFNGWSTEVKRLDVDFVDVSADGTRYNVGVSALLRITLRDGTFHEDVGYGHIENSRAKAAALEKAKKEAVTDAFKRALRSFGRLLGNCSYDKKFVEVLSKMKPEPAKFDPSMLKRGPHPSILKGDVGQPSAEASAPVKQTSAATAGPSSRPSGSNAQGSDADGQRLSASPSKRAATTPANPDKLLMIEEKRREAQRKQDARRLAIAEAEAKARGENEAKAKAQAKAQTPVQAQAQPPRPVESHLSASEFSAPYAEPIEEDLDPPPSQAFCDVDDSFLSEAMFTFEASANAAQDQGPTLAADDSFVAEATAPHDDSGVVFPASRQHLKGPAHPPSARPAASSLSRTLSMGDMSSDDSSPHPIVKPEPQADDSPSSHAKELPKRTSSKGRFVGAGGASGAAKPGMTHGPTSLSNAAQGRASSTVGQPSRPQPMHPPGNVGPSHQRPHDASLALPYGVPQANGAATGARAGAGGPSRTTAAQLVHAQPHPTSAKGAPVTYLPPTSIPPARGGEAGFRTALEASSAGNTSDRDLLAREEDPSALKKQRLS